MSATISHCGTYRYTLFRKWADGPSILFVMLNPSTADAKINDATTKQCIRFAKREGFGSMYLGNVYGYRSKCPKFLKDMSPTEAAGEDNEKHLNHMITKCSKIVVAWGNPGMMGSYQIREILKDKALYCLGVNKNKSPKHPLYLPGNTEFEPWEWPSNKLRG